MLFSAHKVRKSPLLSLDSSYRRAGKKQSGAIMSYTALYRRYRPDDFSALVGQPHIAKVLSTAIRRGSFVHA